MKGEEQTGRQRFSLPNPEKEKEEQVRELVTLAEARTRAKRFLKVLKQNFPRKRKITIMVIMIASLSESSMFETLVVMRFFWV